MNDSNEGRVGTGNWKALAKAIQSGTVDDAFKSYCWVIYSPPDEILKIKYLWL